MKTPNITSTIILLAIPPLALFFTGLGNENLVPMLYIDIALLFLATLAKYFTQKKETDVVEPSASPSPLTPP